MNIESSQQKKQVNLCNQVTMYYNVNISYYIIIVVHLWAEYLELVLPDYYMIPSEFFPDIEKDGDGDDRFVEGIWCLHYIKNTYGTFYYPNGTKVVVYTGTFPEKREKNDYTGSDPVFQTDEQLTHTVLLRDVGSATPRALTSGYEGLYKCIIDDRTLVVGVYDTSTYNDNSELMMSCVVIV